MGKPADEMTQVQCATCHRGSPNPRVPIMAKSLRTTRVGRTLWVRLGGTEQAHPTYGVSRDRELVVSCVEAQSTLQEIATRFGMSTVSAARMAVGRAPRRLTANLTPR